MSHTSIKIKTHDASFFIRYEDERDDQDFALRACLCDICKAMGATYQVARMETILAMAVTESLDVVETDDESVKSAMRAFIESARELLSAWANHDEKRDRPGS